MSQMTTRPTLLKGLLDSWQLTLAHGRARELVPVWIIASAGLGAVAAWFLPAKFWNGEELDAVVGALGGLLTFNGIVLALCWSAFGKVYEIIGAGAFSAHLRKHNLLSHYLVLSATAISRRLRRSRALPLRWQPYGCLCRCGS